MFVGVKQMVVFIVISIFLRQFLCKKMKLFQTDGRVTTVSETITALSLLQCSIISENDASILSFNYNKDKMICELSNNYPNGSTTTTSTGWNVYVKFGSSYYIGLNRITRSEAEAVCDSMSARLAILESQEEIDYIKTLVADLDHWIGMTCTSGVNYKWDDGMDVDTGFTAWAPGEPGGRYCVMIGYYGDKWDDTFCFVRHKALCEYV